MGYLVAYYLDPPENALVLSMDEKPAIPALERAQGWLRFPNGEALRGFSHEYKRHGTITLFAALNIATREVIGECPHRHRHQEFLKFLKRLDKEVPDKELHLVVEIWFGILPTRRFAGAVLTVSPNS